MYVKSAILILTTIVTSRCAIAQSDSAMVFTVSKLVNDTSLIYTFAEKMPEYPGGDAELMRYIRSTIQYPQMEKDNHISGKVIIRFVIEKDGTVSNTTVTKSASPGIDREVMRVLKTLRFTPAIQQSKPVRVYYNLPMYIDFK